MSFQVILLYSALIGSAAKFAEVSTFAEGMGVSWRFYDRWARRRLILPVFAVLSYGGRSGKR
jgi:hypothetical protein